MRQTDNAQRDVPEEPHSVPVTSAPITVGLLSECHADDAERLTLTSGERHPIPLESAYIALRLVSEYANRTGASPRITPVRELIVDLTADLMHLCAQSGISFEAVSEEAAAIVAADRAEALPSTEC